MNTEQNQQSRVLGNTAQVVFITLRGGRLEGKVDTGATTSSLHAENIQINKQQRTVSFQSPKISNNVITVPLAGAQEVHSADAGGVTRPIVTLDVEIDGVAIPEASFNLNDRSQMDSHVLIGQNILQAGQFTIDPSKNAETANTADVTDEQPTRESMILNAIEVLAENDVSLGEIMQYLQTAAVNRLKD